MQKIGSLAVALLLAAAGVVSANAAEVSGDYLELRTCDVYTGPCFANGEIGLTGRQAMLAWSIDQGSHEGVDLAGLKVVLSLTANDTLGFGGGLVCNPDQIKSVVLVDQRATDSQRDALVDFVKTHAAKVAGEVVRVADAPIEMNVDHVDMVGTLKAGDQAQVLTRKLGQGDCVCSNEMVFYPPLTQVDNYAPAYTVEGQYTGGGLGVRWATPKARSAFLATFAY